MPAVDGRGFQRDGPVALGARVRLIVRPQRAGLCERDQRTDQRRDHRCDRDHAPVPVVVVLALADELLHPRYLWSGFGHRYETCTVANRNTPAAAMTAPDPASQTFVGPLVMAPTVSSTMTDTNRAAMPVSSTPRVCSASAVAYS